MSNMDNINTIYGISIDVGWKVYLDIVIKNKSTNKKKYI